MQQVKLTLAENEPIADKVFRLRLTGDASGVTAPGQFVNVALPGLYLRRPISVCDADKGNIILIYKVVGHGTEVLSAMPAGTELDVLTGLGNGYDLSRAGSSPLLIGGGVGVPPLYMLAKRLREQGREVNVILGFNRAAEIFYVKEFRDLGAGVTVTTVDGSCGVPGFVTNALPESCSFFYACGPLPMLKAVYRKTVTEGQFSLEERMGCGFGACMGCSVLTSSGPKRVCREGPVFDKEDLLW